MRKYVVIFLLFAPVLHAQSDETVTIKKSDLTPAQIAKVEAEDFAKRAEQYGKWVGVGHEVGVAVNEGLSAVSSQANSFAQTPVGKWTMFVIIFKVIGGSAIGIAWAVCEMAVALPVWLWSYRKFLPQHICVKELVDRDTGKLTQRVFDIVDPKIEDCAAWRVGHWIVLAILITVACIAVFANI